MALTKSLWTTIVDLVSTGQNVSDNLDTAFTNIDTAITQIDTNVTDIAALDTRLTAEEARLNSAVSIVTTSPLAAQTLVSGVPEKLEWMTSALVDSGTDITYNLLTDNITIATAGTYKVYGIITAEIPINDIVSIELYVDNLPTGFHTEVIGRGTGKNVTFNYSIMAPFIVNDDITLYVTSSGTEITVHTASVTIEKTGY